jgi:tetratricopeptide (TPR) repeat protein
LDIVLRILLLACLLVFLIAWLYPAYWNWAIFNLDMIKPFNFIFLAFIALLLIVPSISRVVYEIVSKIIDGMWETANRLPSLFKHALWIILLIAVLFLLKTNSYILGDGHQILGNAISDNLLSPTAIGFTLMMQSLQKLLNISTIAGMAILISSFSILCGIIFVYYINKIIGLLTEDRKLRPILFLVLISSAVIVLFIGYIETYPILIAWLAIYFYYSLRFTEGKCGPMLLLILFTMGIFWHLWFIAFLPSLIFVLNNRYKLISNKTILILSFAYVIAIYVMGLYFTRGEIPLMIPFMPTEESKYFLFAPQHLIDYLNLLFISGPVLTLLAVPLIIISTRSLRSTKLKLLLYTSAPTLAIAFCISPEVGAVRDWDLFSVFFLPLILTTLMLFSLKAGAKSNLKFLILSMLLINLMHTASFIDLNKDKEASVNRVVKVLLEDAHFQSDYYGGRRAIPFGAILSNIYNRHDLGTVFTERGVSSFTEEQGYLELANQFYSAQDWEKASCYYGLVPQNVTMSAKNHFTYAQSLFFMQRYETAIEQLGIALKDTLESSICLLLGDCFLSQDKIDSALKYYDLGLSSSPDSAGHLTNIAQILYDKKINQAALSYCRRILAINSRDIDQMVMLGQIHQRLRVSDSAFHYFNVGLEQDSSSYPAAVGLVNYYYQKADFSGALDILRGAERHNPDNPDIPFKIGFMFKVMNRHNEAIEALRRTLKLDPDHLQARHFMAEVFIGMNMADSALAQWDLALAIDSSFLPGYFGQARAYDKLGNAEMAKKSLEICLRLNPQMDLDPDAKSLLEKYKLGN